jgi:hypothetical protein
VLITDASRGRPVPGRRRIRQLSCTSRTLVGLQRQTGRQFKSSVELIYAQMQFLTFIFLPPLDELALIDVITMFVWVTISLVNRSICFGARNIVVFSSSWLTTTRVQKNLATCPHESTDGRIWGWNFCLYALLLWGFSYAQVSLGTRFVNSASRLLE